MKYTFYLSLTALILAGCTASQHPAYQKKGQSIIVSSQTNQWQQMTEQTTPPPPPKKKIKLKKVENHNYSDQYMYPENNARVKQTILTPVKKPQVMNESTMSKEECISMIGEEKFNKYTALFGSQAASLKRCTMIKAMKR
jgi:uncharacterized protein YcfL